MSETRKCKKCSKVKPLNLFNSHSCGWRHECKECERKRFNKWAAGRRDVTSAKNRARYERLKQDPEWVARFRARQRELQPGYNRVLRDAVYAAYGGPKCACCGEDELLFLTVDHINNDGKHRRKEEGMGLRFYQWLKRNQYPSGFQVLCYNCNLGKARNKGICPHKSRQEGSTIIPEGSRTKRSEAQSTRQRVKK